MTPAEFTAIRKTVAKTQALAGELLGVDRETIGRIERGEKGDPVPVMAEYAIRWLAQAHPAP